MRVIQSIDIPRLEDVLIERILGRPSGGLIDPVLVIVPTSRLGTHIQRRLLERADAVLGVHCLTHMGLASGALRYALEPEPRILGPEALSALVERLVSDVPGREGDYLRAHPGARDALRNTLSELRDGGIAPRDLAKLPAGETGKRLGCLAEVYAEYSTALERLAEKGWTDRAGLVRKAIPLAGAFLRGKGIRGAFHHGAYDLIGVHLELLDAVASAADLTVLLPAEPQGRAFAYARRFAEALRARGAKFEAPPPPRDSRRAAWIARLRRLHEPERLAALDPAAPAAPSLGIRHVQGPEAELRAAALEALALHSQHGFALEELAIVARRLEPYKPFIESTLGALRIPFTSSATEPITRDPAASALLSILRVLARGYERRPTIDLLRRRDVKVGDPWTGDVDRWDRWSLKARIVAGLDSWRSLEGLVRPFEAPRSAHGEDPATARAGETAALRSVRRLLDSLGALEDERKAWQRERSHADHAAYLRDLARRLILTPAGVSPDEALRYADLVADAVEAAGAALAASGLGSPRPSLEEIETLARAAAQAPMRIRGRDEGGIRVLDLMQARGLHHRAIIWIGFHASLFPRRAREDSYLSDASRAQLSGASGLPLEEKLAGKDEERLLLAMTFASATEVLGITYQRAGDAGGKEPRSSALREVARMFTGSPDVAALLSDEPDNRFRPEHVSAHPGEEARALARSPRVKLFPPRETPPAAATLSKRGTAVARAAARALSLGEADVLQALACVDSIESFAPGGGAFDGETGLGFDLERPLFPSAIERLSRCPQSFFLQDVLHLRELEAEPIPHRIEKRLLGDAAHAALAKLYRGLADDGLLVPGSGAKAEALARIGPTWREELERVAGPSYGRLHGLFTLLGDDWLRALERFVEADADAVAALGAGRIDLESRFEAGITFGESGEVKLGAWFDRLLVSPSGVALDDYKTGKTADKVNPDALLRGFHLQLPLYREVAAASLGVPPAAVKARLLPVGPDAEEEPAALEAGPMLRGGILETVGVVLSLARRGRFPLVPARDTDPRYCGWCAYRRTCRKNHQPTLERLEKTAYLEDFRLAKEKDEGCSTLEAVRARREAEADGSGGGS